MSTQGETSPGMSTYDSPPQPYTQEVATSIVLRPTGNPLPLGLFGIGAGAFIVAAEQLGWLPAAETASVGWLLFAFAVPLGLLSTLMSISSRDTTAGTAMGLMTGTLAGFALSFLVTAPFAAATSSAATSHVFAWFLFASAAALGLTALTSAMNRPILAGAQITFAAWATATAIFELSGASGWQDVAGIVGLVTTATAAIAAALREAAEESIHGHQKQAAFESPMQPSAPANRNGHANGSGIPEGIAYEPGVRAVL